MVYTEEEIKNQVVKIDRNVNVFGLKRKSGVDCSLFGVCEFVGERCKICAKNRNNDNYIGEY